MSHCWARAFPSISTGPGFVVHLASSLKLSQNHGAFNRFELWGFHSMVVLVHNLLGMRLISPGPNSTNIYNVKSIKETTMAMRQLRSVIKSHVIYCLFSFFIDFMGLRTFLKVPRHFKKTSL